MHSNELRQRLHALELLTGRSTAAVTDARAAHASAIKEAVLTGNLDAPAQAEAVLDAARSTHTRTLALVEEARTCLAAALQQEKVQAQATARAEVEAELAAIAENAADIDAGFTALVDRVLELRARELTVRQKTRQNFSEAWGGPEYLGALRSIAGYLNAVASGILQPDGPSSVAKAAASGAHAVRRATSGN